MPDYWAFGTTFTDVTSEPASPGCPPTLIFCSVGLEEFRRIVGSRRLYPDK